MYFEVPKSKPAFVLVSVFYPTHRDQSWYPRFGAHTKDLETAFTTTTNAGKSDSRFGLGRSIRFFPGQVECLTICTRTIASWLPVLDQPGDPDIGHLWSTPSQDLLVSVSRRCSLRYEYRYRTIVCRIYPLSEVPIRPGLFHRTVASYV